jgi:hypothetical protein
MEMFIVGFKVLSAVTMKSRPTVLWDLAPCSPVEVYRHFGGTFCFSLQGRKVSQARKSIALFLAGSLLGLPFHAENGGSTFFRSSIQLLTDCTALYPRI